ncbi:MAG: hypothetical protein IPG68_04180 [Micrococcales bacterium]|nr:hypothetical protein [Micrococcales bacterium]
MFATRSGRPLHNANWTSTFKRAKTQLGLDDCHLHDFRHPAATAAVQSGVTLKTFGAIEVAATEKTRHDRRAAEELLHRCWPAGQGPVEAKRKHLRNIKVTKKAGKTLVRTFGTPVRVRLTYRAAGTSVVDAFRQVRRHSTR